MSQRVDFGAALTDYYSPALSTFEVFSCQPALWSYCTLDTHSLHWVHYKEFLFTFLCVCMCRCFLTSVCMTVCLNINMACFYITARAYLYMVVHICLCAQVSDVSNLMPGYSWSNTPFKDVTAVAVLWSFVSRHSAYICGFISDRIFTTIIHEP